MKTNRLAFLKYVEGNVPAKMTFECSICQSRFKGWELILNQQEASLPRRDMGPEFKRHVQSEHPNTEFRRPAEGGTVMLQGRTTFVEYTVLRVDQQTAELKSINDGPGARSSWAHICYFD